MNLRQLCSKCLKLGAVIAICAIALNAGDKDKDKDKDKCHKSPENPAIVLALLGTAGVAWRYLHGRARL